jgi:uncharacterized membrane protein HdeD (DUF308 family)
VLILLGTVVLGSVVVASLAVAVVIGGLILAGGLVESVGAFWSRRWSGFFLHLLSGVLSIVIGVLFLTRPVGALEALTLLTAGFLLVGGMFKIAAAASLRFESWAWPLFGGLIDATLGILILLDFPASALWVLGMFLGISMVFRGVNWIGLGFALKSLPAPAKP